MYLNDVIKNLPLRAYAAAGDFCDSVWLFSILRRAISGTQRHVKRKLPAVKTRSLELAM